MTTHTQRTTTTITFHRQGQQAQVCLHFFFERRPVLITITSDGDNPTDTEALINGSAWQCWVWMAWTSSTYLIRLSCMNICDRFNASAIKF